MAEPTLPDSSCDSLNPPYWQTGALLTSPDFDLQTLRRLLECLRAASSAACFDDPASQHASSTPSMLLWMAERRAAEPCCMKAVIQPTVLL